MTTVTEYTTPNSPPADVEGPDPKRWLALGVIAIAQLMVVLDASIVTIALRSARTAHLRGEPAVGGHRLHPLLRRPAAPRRSDRRLHGSQAHVRARTAG